MQSMRAMRTVAPKTNATRPFCFLAGSSQKKVDVLLRAFARAKIGKEWSVDLVGLPWSQVYLSWLKAIIDERKLGERGRFRGQLFGEEKRELIDAAWVLACAIALGSGWPRQPEAAARCLATIATHQAGLHDWELGGDLLVELNIDTLRQALEIACSWSAQEQRDRGVASRRLVQQR